MPAFSLERKRRRKKLQKFLPKRCYLHGKSSTRSSSSLKDVFFPSTTTATTTTDVEIPEIAQHYMVGSQKIFSPASNYLESIFLNI